MQNVVPLAKAIVNRKTTKIDAVLALADLVALMSSFLTISQRYRVADRLRNIADQAERADVVAHRALRADIGGDT
jgi:hypothetical protein